MNNLYKEDSIESLSPLEHVRLRPGMYCGDTSDATQLAIEILGNAIDEYNIGHGNIIIINLNNDNSIVIEDLYYQYEIAQKEYEKTYKQYKYMRDSFSDYTTRMIERRKELSNKVQKQREMNMEQ